MEDIVGVDFDNTIVDYSDVMHSAAVRQGLISPGVRQSKKDIRDAIRHLPDGEIKWQKLQAIVYGPMMGAASLIDGVRTFFELCKQHKVRAYIVSHKTEFARRDETSTNLREAALAWMSENGFFEADGMGLSRHDVYFESTRREKIERIRRLGCTHFIDDLEETFLEESFPADVEKILYAPHVQHSSLQGVKVAATWKEICDYFFDARG
jgi:hypothetical protein